jgi:hypothetical protein
LTGNVIECSHFIFLGKFLFFYYDNRNYIIKYYLFKERLIFPSFTFKLMLLLIIMNMSNSRVYFMRQNASA